MTKVTLRPNSKAIIKLMQDFEDPIGVASIARVLGLSHAVVESRLEEMEEAGIVARDRETPNAFVLLQVPEEPAWSPEMEASFQEVTQTLARIAGEK